MNRLWRATVYSWNGLVAAARSELPVRQELVVLALAIPLAFYLTAEAPKRFALIGVLVIVLIVELLNTAIEKLADRVTRKKDAAIGRVKDIGSAAVAISVLLAGAMWLWIVAERFWP